MNNKHTLDIFLPECMSEKSRLVFGRGTVPGSERTARKCDMTIRNITTLKTTTFTAPTRLHKSKPKSKYKTSCSQNSLHLPIHST